MDGPARNRAVWHDLAVESFYIVMGTEGCQTANFPIF